MNKNYKPKGFHSITPYVFSDNPVEFINFLMTAFDGEEFTERSLNKDGTVANAQVRIGDSIIEISQAREEFPSVSCNFHLYVPDAEQAYKKAIEAGGIGQYPPQKQDYGDLECYVIDKFGNHWFIATMIDER